MNSAESEASARMAEKSPDILLIVLDWLKTFLFVILLGVLLTAFVIQRNTISGPSMEPTLNHQDQIFVEKISKNFSIKRGDIITIDKTDPSNPDTLLIKRVVALPGERIQINNGAVYIDGNMLEETYLPDGLVTNIDKTLDFCDVSLKEDQYFVLGDNRILSRDSRKFGPIEQNQIIGKVLIRFYPLDQIGKPE